MTKQELIALVQTIFEPLQLAGFTADLERMGVILGGIFGSNRVEGYEALERLRDLLLGDTAELPPEAGITSEEWSERRVDFCRAAEMFLDGKWKKAGQDTLN